jgi:hypothetical protein
MGFFIAPKRGLTREESEMQNVNKNGEYRFHYRPRKNPLKLTALFYLKEALAQERYEKCQEIIILAKRFGAKEYEIDALLEDPRRTPT